MACVAEPLWFVLRPLDIIREVQDAEGQHHDPAGTSISSRFSQLLSSCGSDESIPLLTKEALSKGKLPANSLVRFRGMVQDIHDPEFFLGSYDEVEDSTGTRRQVHFLYSDNLVPPPGWHVDFGGAGSVTMDRVPLSCTLVPGHSAWAKDCGTDNQAVTCTELRDEALLKPSRHKRPADTMLEQEAFDTEASNKMTLQEKRPSTTGTHRGPGLHADTSSVSGSAAAGGDFSCIVKIYKHECGFKLNEVVEFVGILDIDQSYAHADADGQEAVDPQSGFTRRSPAASVTPRLHCVLHRRLELADSLGVDPASPLDQLYRLQGPLPFAAFMLHLRGQVIELLAAALGGDLLAAEYTLLCLVSKVYQGGQEGFPPLGSLSIHLSGAGPATAPALQRTLSQLVPASVLVPLTLDKLNREAGLAPKRDPDNLHLARSELQLARGTVVIVDETGLQPGQINSHGLRSLAALRSILRRQQLPYDFTVYSLDFEVDHPSIVLSEAGPILEATLRIPLQAVGDAAPEHLLKAQTDSSLHKLRTYLAAVRLMKCTLDPSLVEVIGLDYAQARQLDTSTQADNLHHWLTLAKLYAQSVGKSTLQLEHWHYIKDLESNRRRRVAGQSGEGTTDLPYDQPMTEGHDSPSSVMMMDQGC